MYITARSILLAVVLTGCGDDAESAVDASAETEVVPCVDEPVTLTVNSPSTYACGMAFAATVSVGNGSCKPITVQEVELTAAVTQGACEAAAPASYPPATASIGAGKTVVVLDLATGPFCCGAPGCPATFECDETFTFAVTTSVGVLTLSADAHLSLGGCGEVCR